MKLGARPGISFVVVLLVAGCGGTGHLLHPATKPTPPSDSTPTYTVQQAASDLAAELPTAPFNDQTYDLCVATYLFQVLSPPQVQALIANTETLIDPPSGSPAYAAEANCVMAGAGTD